MCVTFITHGSRHAAANQFVRDLIQKLEGRAANLGFLEWDHPHVIEAVESHIQAGCEVVHLIPLFLMPGRHVSHDIPQIVNTLRQKYPQVRFELQPFVAEQPEFVAFLQSLLAELGLQS